MIASSAKCLNPAKHSRPKCCTTRQHITEYAKAVLRKDHAKDVVYIKKKTHTHPSIGHPQNAREEVTKVFASSVAVSQKSVAMRQLKNEYAHSADFAELVTNMPSSNGFPMTRIVSACIAIALCGKIAMHFL